MRVLSKKKLIFLKNINIIFLKFPNKNFNKSIWWMPRLIKAMKDVVRLR